MIYARITLFLISLSWTNPLFASSFHCDSEQVICLVDNKKLTTGDVVGFVDRRNRLVAVGKVVGIQDHYREVELTETFAVVTAKEQIRLLTAEEKQRFTTTSYQAKQSIGVSASMARLNVASGLGGQEYNLSFTRNLHEGLGLAVRSIYTRVAGSATEVTYFVTTEHDMIIHGYGMIGGLSYELPLVNFLSAKAELGAGTMVISHSTGSNTSLEDVKLDNRISDGANLLIKASASLLFDISLCHAELLISNNSIYRSHLASFGLGLVTEL